MGVRTILAYKVGNKAFFLRVSGLDGQLKEKVPLARIFHQLAEFWRRDRALWACSRA